MSRSSKITYFVDDRNPEAGVWIKNNNTPPDNLNYYNWMEVNEIISALIVLRDFKEKFPKEPEDTDPPF